MQLEFQTRSITISRNDRFHSNLAGSYKIFDLTASPAIIMMASGISIFNEKAAMRTESIMQNLRETISLIKHKILLYKAV